MDFEVAMSTWVVDGVSYVFPDDFSEERVTAILSKQGIIQSSQALPELPPAPVAFQPPGAISTAIEEVSAEEAAAQQRARGRFIADDVALLEEQAATAEEMRASIEAPRQQVLEAGRLDEPKRVETGGLPFFRPSAIQTVPAYSERIAMPQSIAPFRSEEDLLTTMEEEQRAAAALDYPYPMAPEWVASTPARAIADAETGDLREPTTFEEVRESFALQPVMTEAQAREAERELAAQQREIDRRIEAGEELGFFERNPGSFMGEVLTNPEQGAGIIESKLGAVPRYTLGWLSALAGEGYFGGLGYEVDENGYPVDPDDFAIQIGKLRESMGLPEYVVPTTGGGLTTIPLPGFATRREQAQPTRFDPTGSRRIDPDADSLLQRVAQSVAKGRTLGDDYASTPALRDYYEATFGDPDAAYYAGLVPEIFTPAGPGVALQGAGKAISAGSRAVKAEPFLDAVAAATAARRAAATGADYSSELGSAAIAAGQQAQRSAAAQGVLSSGAVNRVADFVAAVRPGRAADGRITRRVAERVLDRSGLGTDLPRIKAAIKPTSNTIKEVMRDIKPLMPAPMAQRVERLIMRNVPDDYTLVTDFLAVPRMFEKEAKARLGSLRNSVLMKDSSRIASDLRELARTAPADTADALLSAAARVSASIERADGIARHGYKGLDRTTRTAVKSAVRRAGEDAATFDRLGPADFAKAEAAVLDEAIAAKLAAASSWDELDASMLRDAMRLRQKRGLESALSGHLRNTRDLTAAQLRFRTAEAGLVKALSSTKTLSSPLFRRLRAAFSRGTLTETAAAALAAERIKQAAQEALRTLSRQLYKLSSERGSVDEALDVMLLNRLSAAGLDAEQAWKRVLSNLYGEDVAERALSLITRYSGSLDRYPTVQRVKQIDLDLTRRGDLPGLATTLPGFAPDYHRAFLKTMIEDGIRKTIAADRRLQAAAGAGVDIAEELGLSRHALRRASERPQPFDDLAAEQAEALRKVLATDPAAAQVSSRLPISMEVGERYRVYDPVASHAERLLAESGEELAQIIESVPQQTRASVQEMAKSAFHFLTSTGRRNAVQRMKYGYIVPNLPYLGYRLLEAPIISLSTIGAAKTAGGLRQLLKRRLSGGGIETADGVRYSEKQLAELAEQYPLGISRVETERIGSLAGDMLRDAKKAARTGPAGKLLNFAVEYLNPLDRGFYQRTAEALELNYRRAVFESRLIAGDEPVIAARTARKSQFDYEEVPAPVREFVGRYLATASNYYKIMGELGRLIKDNPQAATAAMKTQRERAKIQDPFNLHGDKGLKSLGIIDLGEDGSFYGPAVPFLAPVERTLAAMRGADVAVRGLKEAAQLVWSGDVEDAIWTVIEGGVPITRMLGDELLPGVWAAFEDVEAGSPYTTQDVGNAEPISDEKMFWAMALWAHHADPTREGGEWQAFERYMQPEMVPPPQGMGHPELDYVWTKQPPGGVPHVFWGRDKDNLPLYYVLKPTDKGLRNIRRARTLAPEQIERALPLMAAMRGELRAARSGPDALYISPLVPESVAGAAASALLAPTGIPDTATGVRAQQEAIRRVREEIQ